MDIPSLLSLLRAPVSAFTFPVILKIKHSLIQFHFIPLTFDIEQTFGFHNEEAASQDPPRRSADPAGAKHTSKDWS